MTAEGETDAPMADRRSNSMPVPLSELTFAMAYLAYRGHVKKLAQRNKRGNSALADDLEQEGYIGLQKATRSFDPARGVDFWTYAHRCVRRNMIAYLVRHGYGVVTTGADRRRSGTRVFFHHKKVFAQHGVLNVNESFSAAVLERVANDLAVSLNKLKDWLPCLRAQQPIEIDDASAETLATNTETTHVYDPTDDLDRSLGWLSVRGALEILTQCESEIIYRRYLKTPSDSRVALGADRSLFDPPVSGEWVRILELRALNKIRKALGCPNVS